MNLWPLQSIAVIFALTSKRALFRFKTVFNPRMKNPDALRRFVSAGMLLFVFFLPLHFHPVVTTAQVTKECSCVHGNRTDAGLAAVPVLWIPVLPAQPLADGSLAGLTNLRFQNHGIRAPPSQPLSAS
ncbi:MAG TPA: hypothetical protein VJ864_04095 [Candidatus Binatia bacterium]|jgi:hypothetical protein|nr:hypothetical protein [Candidatus Binatia bacterium]